MADSPVYVEAEDELSGVMDRLRVAAVDEVALVLPVGSRFGRSRFDFQLLRQFASRMGKRVVIVSSDPSVQRMAEEGGLPTVPFVPSGLTRGGAAPWAGIPAAAPPALSTPAVPAQAVPAQAVPAPADMPPAGAWGPLAAPSDVAATPPRPEPAVTAPSQRYTEIRPSRSSVRPGPPPKMAGRSPRRLLFYAAAVLLLVIGVVSSVVFLPSAEIVMVTQAQPAATDLAVSGDVGRPPIPVREATASKSLSQNFNVTSVTSTQAAQATGTVQLDTANCGGLGFTVPNGTLLRGPGGIEFATNGGDVNVGGNGNPQQAQTAITATQPGGAGNVAQGAFAFENPGAGGCIQITGGPTQGGADAQQKKIIQQTDLTAAQNTLEQALQQQLTDMFTKSAEAGEKLVSDQVVWKPQPLHPSKNIGDETPTFTASLVENATAYYYHPSDVQAAMRAAVEKHVPAGKQVAGELTTNYQVAAGANGHLTFTGRASYYLATRLNMDAIKSMAAGRSPGDVERALQRQYHAETVQVQQFPFGLPFMPLSSTRVTVRYQILSGPPPKPTS